MANLRLVKATTTITITDSMKLSDIAKIIESLPVGETRLYKYERDGYTAEKTLSTSAPITEIMVSLLMWMNATNDELYYSEWD